MTVSNILDIIIILVVSLLCSGFIFSRPHHSPLAYFVTSFIPILITYPLIILCVDALPLGLKYLGRLVVLSAFFIGYTVILVICVRIKHSDYFF